MTEFPVSITNKENKTSNSTSTLTKGQKEALDGIIEFINSPYNSSRAVYSLVGSAGVGKTFLTKMIIRNCKIPNSHIKCTSPTHKACRVFSESCGIKVETIQSTFGFRLNLNIEDFDYNNPAFRPISIPKLQNIELLICDEASMLNAALVNYIENICKKHRIKILYIGDAAQIAPINERKSTAFTKANKIYKLTEIVRQGEGNPILTLLDYLRYDIEHAKIASHTFLDYINKNMGKYCYNSVGEGFSIINPREFTNTIRNRFNDEEYTENINLFKIIAYTNECVTKWNNFVRTTIIKDNDRGIITKNDLMMSYQTIVDEFNDIIVNNSEEYIVNDISKFVDSRYGFSGYMLKLQMVNGGDITKPLFVIDHTDKSTVLLYVKVLDDLVREARESTGGTRATNWKKYYDFKKLYLTMTNFKRGTEVVYSRDLDYAFAITSHRAQGSTYNNVFVDLNDMIFRQDGGFRNDYEDMLRRIYVACSRARNQLIISYGR